MVEDNSVAEPDRPEIQESEAVPPESPAVETPAAPPAPSEGRFRRGLRRAIRWTAGLLLVFALGMMVATLAFYLPKARQVSEVESLRGQANLRIEELESELDAVGTQIEALEQNQDTQQEALNLANLHIFILSTLVDVTGARLALAQGNAEDARLALANTSDTLASLEGLVDGDQVEAIRSMQQRLDLALSVLDEDPEASKSDLEVLANNLVKLENTYFVVP